MIVRQWFSLLVAAVLLWGGMARAQVVDGVELIKASLLADRTAVVPGENFQAGVLLQIAPGWHTYWRNPGDAGIPVTMQWDLPEGFVAGPIEWPLPRRYIEPGDLFAFGYKKEVLLPVRISVPEALTEEEISLAVRVNWLVCEAICVPGRAELSITLPVAETAAADNEEVFAAALSAQAQTEAPPFPLSWQQTPTGWAVEVAELPEWVTSADFLAYEDQSPLPGHTEAEQIGPRSWRLSLPTGGEIKGLFLLTGADNRAEGWEISSPGLAAGADAGDTDPVPQSVEAREGAGGTSGIPALPSLWLALVYGFIGGMILNLMPCVLPVISLKIFGFIRQAGEEPARILRHGLAFTGGIFLWFLGLAALLALLRGAGEQITWAFQFQNPWFILFIAAVVFVFALNLFGVFEIILPGSASSKMSEAAGREGYGGSFFQGIFATLLATPCTAPFLGTALGFAFAQPVGVIFAMFGSVALGMALPYLLLSARPAWVRFLPKPGAWMERLKQFMGFPLMATAIWLLFILGGQKGTGGIIWALSILLCLGLACWVYGSFCLVNASAKAWRAGMLALVIAVGGSWYFGGLFARAERPLGGEAVAGEGIPWVPFTQAKVDELLAEGKSVFIDFTADWCLTCKFNERTAINTPAVRRLIEERGIVPVKADWTNSNPEITAALAQFNRVGVPFVIFYPEGRRESPVLFPELLTESIVLEKLRTP
jgi:thiol:disulfide interchange protein/DsbC/DsbD-like thiol-disulfide interchange protein